MLPDDRNDLVLVFIEGTVGIDDVDVAAVHGVVRDDVVELEARHSEVTPILHCEDRIRTRPAARAYRKTGIAFLVSADAIRRPGSGDDGLDKVPIRVKGEVGDRQIDFGLANHEVRDDVVGVEPLDVQVAVVYGADEPIRADVTLSVGEHGLVMDRAVIDLYDVHGRVLCGTHLHLVDVGVAEGLGQGQPDLVAYDFVAAHELVCRDLRDLEPAMQRVDAHVLPVRIVIAQLVQRRELLGDRIIGADRPDRALPLRHRELVDERQARIDLDARVCGMKRLVALDSRGLGGMHEERVGATREPGHRGRVFARVTYALLLEPCHDLVVFHLVRVCVVHVEQPAVRAGTIEVRLEPDGQVVVR